MISEAERAAVIAEAARAPSVHNVQPARWRFVGDEIVLFRERGRELSVADPTSHDLGASLGAAFEGMGIALSRLGVRLGLPREERKESATNCEAMVRAPLERGGVTDSLAEFVRVRRSFRGRFGAPTAAARAALATIAADDVIVVSDAKAIDDIAKLHERATWTFESRADYHEELWSWLRLSPNDARWYRDGLNADCLALNRVERLGAQLLLQPSTFRLLTKLGVARALISEAPQVRSATGIALFVPRASDTPFDVGRRFYRLWLEITRAGLYAAPMSACADDANVNRLLRDAHGVPDERRVANVLRIGPIAADTVAVSPRLPANEWRV